MKNYFVTIIVPNYNHSSYLNWRLESIFNQTHKNFEVILMDDYSTDRSRDLLVEYSKHPKVSHCIFNDENTGSPFKQWGRGIALARGEYIWIAESDDFCKNTFLEHLLKPHQEDSSLALSFCQSHRVNAEGEVIGNWITHTSGHRKNAFVQDFKMDGNEFIENYLIHKNVIPNVSAVLFKTKELNRIVPLVFKPFMKYNADWFYYVQLLCNSRLAFVSESLNYFRSHSNSVIAKAGGESGWIKIFKMELKVREEMSTFIKACSPESYPRIKAKAVVGDLQLKCLIAENYWKRKNLIQYGIFVWSNPQILVLIFKNCVAKLIK